MKSHSDDRPEGTVRRHVLTSLKGMVCWCEVAELAAAANVSPDVVLACLQFYEGEFARRHGDLWRFETIGRRGVTLN
ncbi:hypothetical protein [Phreatobacter stygius]|uniref:Uncharacterized protein n=1 Tax=Phreatobacter stygius TaxID=1940610 RepID=A0A4D7BCQ3_9HYPH|nr:hypothetical protein [Phreatobacter stygius]QCI67156.1 hypothetical protein E8M01_24705 [Phreatobacter stygius]